VADTSAESIVNELRHMQLAGMSDEVMIDYISSKGQTYVLNAEQLIRLEDGGVDDQVIKALLSPQPSNRTQEGTPAMQTVTPPTKVLEVRPLAPAKAEPTLPEEIGVYAKQRGEWNEVLPEIVNWKTGGVVKNLATVGVVKGDVNGHIRGARSHTVCRGSTEFLIIVPDGTAITEYQLLKLRTNGDNREFRTVTGGIFHVSGGATRDLVSFQSKKVRSRTYLVTTDSLSAGEYGFLPPGAIATQNLGSSGKIASFTVQE
jgi:hypothetical protein